MNTLLSKYSCSTYINGLEELAMDITNETKAANLKCDNQQDTKFDCGSCFLYKNYIADTSSQGEYGRGFSMSALNLFLTSK